MTGASASTGNLNSSGANGNHQRRLHNQRIEQTPHFVRRDVAGEVILGAILPIGIGVLFERRLELETDLD